MKKLSVILLSLIMLLFTLFVGGCGEETFTLKYNLNGGTFSASSGVRYEYSADEGEISIPNPWRIGYKFVGWQVGNSQPKKDMKFNASEATNKTFVAVWQEVEAYRVKLNLNYEFKYGGQTFVAECTYIDEEMASAEGFEVKYNENIINLSNATPVLSSSFSFDCWEWINLQGESVKITNTTVFNESIFGEQKQIVLNAKCLSKFTPNA